MMTVLDILQGMELEVPKTKDERYTYQGKRVPRTTEILQDMWHEESLMKWANYLGFKRKDYFKELDYFANIGTIVHDSVEFFLNHNEFPTTPPDYNIINCINAFRKWYNAITKHTEIHVIAMEEKLTCPYFGGTFDLLANIGGKICLIDFKTSKHIGPKYYMQLSAYKYMLSLKGINIDIAMILQLNRDTGDFTEYVVDITNNKQHEVFMNECFECFLSLVYAYFNRQIVTNKFNTMTFNGDEE